MLFRRTLIAAFGLALPASAVFAATPSTPPAKTKTKTKKKSSKSKSKPASPSASSARSVGTLSDAAGAPTGTLG